MGRSLSLLQVQQKNNRTVNKDYKTTSDRQQRTSGAQKSSPLSQKGGGKKNCFSFFFFSFFLFFFFFFFSFFLFFSFLSFLLLVFLSYVLLKSSNTPLLILNFHFHLNITLQKKKRKKKKKRQALFFKLNSIYISKFWVFVFVFKYFISKSLTSTLNFLIFVYQYVI